MLNKDNLRFGLIVGFAAPLLAMFLYYLFQFKNIITFGEFIHIVLLQKNLLTAIISICLVANAAVFTWFINKRKDRTAKGIFIATLIYAGSALIWKFIS